MKLLIVHEAVKLENELLKKQYKLQYETPEETEKEKLKLEIFKLNAKINDHYAKLGKIK